jgi:hypothetical protein
MHAALNVGRVGGLAVALGVGLAIFASTAEASADSGAAGSSGPASAAADDANPAAGPQSATATRVADTRAARGLGVLGQPTPAPAGSSASTGPNSEAPGAAVTAADAAAVSTRTVEVRRPAARAGARNGAGDAAPAAVPVAAAPAAVPVAAAPAAVPVAAAPAAADPAPESSDPVAGEDPRLVVPQPDPSWRDPSAAVESPYGALGKWMLKDGQIADWVGLPYCGPGLDCGTLGQYKGKTVQEPINMVFVVPARLKWEAELKLDFALRRAGFGPSPFSSIGYSGLVGGLVSSQMPRGGILGLGFLPPLPFGLGGLRGLFPIASQPAIGVGSAYRNAPFNQANAHLRTFGGVPDGNGNFIFTASVSDEFLLTTNIFGIIPNPIPTHGYESFVEARETLTTNMLNRGGVDLGIIDMQNQIADFFPRYTTGDHDGYAQVIGVGFGGMRSGPLGGPRSSNGDPAVDYSGPLQAELVRVAVRAGRSAGL